MHEYRWPPRAVASDVLARHLKSPRFLMKVRFLHNRKTSVINTVQIFIGLSWQSTASPLPFLIKLECERTNRQTANKAGHRMCPGGSVTLQQSPHPAKKQTVMWSSHLFEGCCQTLGLKLYNGSLLSFQVIFCWAGINRMALYMAGDFSTTELTPPWGFLIFFNEKIQKFQMCYFFS